MRISSLHQELSGLLNPKREGFDMAKAAEEAGQAVGRWVKDHAGKGPLSKAVDFAFGELGFLSRLPKGETFEKRNPAVAAAAKRTLGIAG